MANEYYANINKYELKGQPELFLHNYFIIQDPNLNEEELENYDHEKFYALQEPCINIPEPKVSLWEFLSKEELDELLKIKNTAGMRKYLDNVKMERYCPKGKSRTVFLNLMYSVTKFCLNQDYSLDKSGALMSQFYLTHILVNTSFDKSAEKVFTYFKELALSHTLPDVRFLKFPLHFVEITLPLDVICVLGVAVVIDRQHILQNISSQFPPKNCKIFSQEETKRNMQFFCRVYLRNLPLIRFICLPNFAFQFKYPVVKKKFDKTSDKSMKGKKKK